MRCGVALQILFHLGDVQPADSRKHEVLLHDIPDFHGAVVFALRVFEGNCNIVRAVDFFADDSRAERVAVQAHHQIQHGGAVVRLDGSVIFVCT